LTGDEIARRIGRSRSVVYKHLRVKAEPNWTDHEISILTALYQRGVPVKKIARRLKRRSPRAVMVKMCRHRKRVRSDPDINRAAFLLQTAFDAGLTPGRAIQKIRACDAYARSKYEKYEEEAN
jgi:hypothetical protein